MQIVREYFLLSFGRFPEFVQFFGRVKSIIGKTVFDQEVSIFFVHRLAFALAVWPQIATKPNTFVRNQATPFQRFDDVFFGSRHKPVLVGIFNA